MIDWSLASRALRMRWCGLAPMAGATPSDWATHQSCKMRKMAQRVDVSERFGSGRSRASTRLSPWPKKGVACTFVLDESGKGPFLLSAVPYFGVVRRRDAHLTSKTSTPRSNQPQRGLSRPTNTASSKRHPRFPSAPELSLSMMSEAMWPLPHGRHRR